MAGFAAMVAVFGVGAVLGSLASARSATLARLKLGYVGGLGILGAGLVGSALAPSLPWALASFFITGFGNSVSMAHDRGLLQHLVPERMLSRAAALTGTIEAWGFAGAALLGGTLASTLGARGVFAVSGGLLLVLAAGDRAHAAARGARPPRPARSPRRPEALVPSTPNHEEVCPCPAPAHDRLQRSAAADTQLA